MLIITKVYFPDGFTIQVQQTSQIEKTHRLSPCKMESPQDQLQGELDYESVHPSYLKRP
ncbi:Integral membrane protein [Lacticaseibacillus paracasei]|nr:Integral membrane protein [Lacticaseibacillus paracasei]